MVYLQISLPEKKDEERLRYLATHDPLTNLPNRDLFHDRLNQALARGKRNKLCVAVMLLDLDNFKSINDTLGHAQGDLVLQAMAERLKGCMRESDIVARMGGDEFTVILEGIEQEKDIITVAEKILKTLSLPIILDRHEHFVSASLGISVYPKNGNDVGSLLRSADIAMYQAKEKNNCYKFYNEG